jgi:hypothetical protein
LIQPRVKTTEKQVGRGAGVRHMKVRDTGCGEREIALGTHGETLSGFDGPDTHNEGVKTIARETSEEGLHSTAT